MPSSAADQPILVTCPVCLHTNWANSTCTHGQVPAPTQPSESAATPCDPVKNKTYKATKGGRK